MSSGSMLFRNDGNTKMVDSILKKNYSSHDVIYNVHNKKKNSPITLLEKTNEEQPFGDIVIKVSWVKVHKIGIKGLEKRYRDVWNWKLIRMTLPK